ncbi:MAG: hypothetical protein U0790_00485 [Isosphaeraceae bacterium]
MFVTFVPAVSAVGHEGVEPLTLDPEPFKAVPNTPPSLDVQPPQPADDIMRGLPGSTFPGLVQQ